MSFTGDQVLVQVNQFFNDASNDRWGSAVKLAALNAAIQAAWPSIKDRKIDSSVTLDGDTYEYTPTAGATTTAGYATLEEGFADSQLRAMVPNVKLVGRALTLKLVGADAIANLSKAERE